MPSLKFLSAAILATILFFPLLAQAQTTIDGVAELNSSRGNDPRTVAFRDISWLNSNAVSATGIDGESVEFEQAEITQILYFDQAQYDAMNGDRRYVANRAGIQNKETVIETHFSTVENDSQLEQIKHRLADLHAFEESAPSTTDQINRVMASLNGIIDKYQSGQREVSGQWMTLEEYQRRFESTPSDTAAPSSIFSQDNASPTTSNISSASTQWPASRATLIPPQTNLPNQMVAQAAIGLVLSLLATMGGLGKRTLALCLDNMVLTIAVDLLATMMHISLVDPSYYLAQHLSNAEAKYRFMVASQHLVPFMALNLCSLFIYFAILDGTGGTIGKRFMGLWVVTETGEPISLFRSIFRSLFRFLSALCLFGFVCAFFNSRQKALHDYLAGTNVVERNT